MHCTCLTNSSEKIPILNFAFSFRYPNAITHYFLSNNDIYIYIHIKPCFSKKVWFSFSYNGINIILLTKCLYSKTKVYILWSCVAGTFLKFNSCVRTEHISNDSCSLQMVYLLSGAQGSPSSWAGCWQSLFPWPGGPRWCHWSTAKETNTFVFWCIFLLKSNLGGRFVT